VGVGWEPIELVVTPLTKHWITGTLIQIPSVTYVGGMSCPRNKELVLGVCKLGVCKLPFIDHYWIETLLQLLLILLFGLWNIGNSSNIGFISFHKNGQHKLRLAAKLGFVEGWEILAYFKPVKPVETGQCQCWGRNIAREHVQLGTCISVSKSSALLLTD